ncbi:MAG: cytochrome c-type biogenesis protein [Nitrospinales bacterium]
MIIARNILASIFIAGFLFAFAGNATAGAVLADLENALMCKCDDKCGKVLINCTCDTSHETRRTLTKHLESGLTFDQVVKLYVDEYGETVLSSPTKNGFNLTAWITPFAALMVGGFGVRKVIQSWTGKKEDSSESSQEPKEPVPEKSKYSSRLKDDLDNMDT